MHIASESSSNPTFFYVSGFPKSGNKWLQWQLIAFDSIGGFHVDPTRGMPLLGSTVLEHQSLRALLQEADVSIERFVRRLYDPSDGDAISLDRAHAARLAAAITDLAAEAAKIRRSPVDQALFSHLMTQQASAAPAATWMNDRNVFAVGVPGMHTPLADVRRDLPSFRIINLQRDPRDVVVSYFYHYISTLTMPLAEKFIVRDPSTGAIARNPKWKRPFARRVMRSMTDYHAKRLPQASERDGVLRVRYEDLLDDGMNTLQRVLGFVGCHESDDAIARVIEANRFERVTGSSSEQRGSLVRKGVSGDWRNYFDRDLLRALGDDFPVIVRELGYEADDSWMDEVPTIALCEFEFSRFRIKRSTTRQFEHLWSASPELRERYPNPWEADDGDSFYTWLCSCDDPDVRAWLDLAHRLEELWAVDVVEQ